MAKTYNGRFDSPPEPRGGGKWIVGGLVMIPLWSIPVVGVGVLVGSVCCFIKGGKMNSEKRMYQRFHEFCAVIGMRQRVSFKELAKAANMSRSDLRQYLQKMLARGYFGSGAYLDINREELILPPAKGYEEAHEYGGWRDIALDILNILRGEKPVQKPVQEKTTAEPAAKPKEKAETRQAPQPKKPASSQKVYMDELEKTLNELYQLNQQIQDEAVSQRIDRIGALVAGIFRVVIEKPEREQEVRKFMNYYLPTTLKLLKSYDMLEDQSYQGENIVDSRKKIENVLDMLIGAYEKQLDRLFHDDALDIATDIDVLETMIAGDGLSDKGRMRMA